LIRLSGGDSGAELASTTHIDVRDISYDAGVALVSFCRYACAVLETDTADLSNIATGSDLAIAVLAVIFIREAAEISVCIVGCLNWGQVSTICRAVRRAVSADVHGNNGRSKAGRALVGNFANTSAVLIANAAVGAQVGAVCGVPIDILALISTICLAG